MTELVFVVPFDGPAATPSTTSIRLEDRIDVVSETVTVHRFTPVTTPPDEQWAWSELRDYVVGQIIEIHGVFPRNPAKEMGIFQAFCGRWGADAFAIARYAFETMGGYWRNAPVSVNRFCQGSDPYFAEMVVRYLHD